MSRTIVITGGTAGIGQQTAIGLARQGERIVVTGRDEARGLEGVQTIQRESGSRDVHLVLGDLAKRAGILALAADLLRQFPRIDVLLNNAGAFAPSLQQSDDGFELCFAVNVAAPYLLTTTLLPALEAARPARVVNLTGGTPSSPLDVENLQAEKGFRGLITYDHSKRALEAMSLSLARELAPRGVFVNVVYPGQAATGMTASVKPAHLPWWMRAFWPLFAWATAADGGKSAAKASRSSVWAATAAELDGVSGEYFDKSCKPGRLHRTVQDRENQERVLSSIERVWGAQR